jgi:hypothetical protein
MKNYVCLTVYFDYKFQVNWITRTRTRFLRVPEFAGSVFLELISGKLVPYDLKWQDLMA